MQTSADLRQQTTAPLEGIDEYESPCLSHSSSQQDYNTASASSGCSSPLSEPTSTSSDTHQFNRRAVATATISVSSQQPTRQPPPRPAVNSRNRHGGSQGHLHTQEAVQITPSASDYFRRPPPSNDIPNQHPRQYSNSPTCQSRVRSDDSGSSSETRPHKERSKSQPKIEKQNSEKHEPKKRELSNQSNSFDDFLRMSHHAGVDDRQSSPSRTRSSKRGISASATELARTRATETEDEIKKVNKMSCQLKLLLNKI